MIASALAAALLSFAGQDGGALLLPGVADLPVLEGAAAAPDCGGMPTVFEGDPVACVTAPIDRIDPLVWAYVREARARGWTDASGAANAIWLEKPGIDGKCQKLTIAGFWDFRRWPEPRPGIPGYVAVSVRSDVRCQTPSAS
jgi:hypothetical protein